MIDPFFWAQPTPRIVQFHKRRYALRLESVFWQQLEKLAKRRNKRLGQLVAELADTCQGINLTSFIRGFCMVEAEKENAHYRLAAGSFDLLDVLRASPAPVLQSSATRMAHTPSSGAKPKISAHSRRAGWTSRRAIRPKRTCLAIHRRSSRFACSAPMSIRSKRFHRPGRSIGSGRSAISMAMPIPYPAYRT